MPLAMLEIENVRERPVEVKGYVRYLLVEGIRGVARYPPASASPSTESSSVLTSLICR
jgi:hypothetical protein